MKQCVPKCVKNTICTTCNTTTDLSACTVCDTTKYTLKGGKCIPKDGVTGGTAPKPPNAGGRRTLEEAEVATKTVETGGITAEVADDDDDDVEVDGIDAEGKCENAEDCKESTTTYNSEGQVVNSEGDIVAESSANLVRFASIFAILAFITAIIA